MNAVELGKTTLVYNRFDTPVSIEVDEVDQPLLLALGKGVSSRVRLEGQEIDSVETWSVCTPGRRVRIERPAFSEILMVKVSYAALQDRLETFLGESLKRDLILAPTCSASGSRGSHLQHLIAFLIREIDRDPGLLRDPFWCQGYDETLLSVLVGLDSNYAAQLQREVLSAPQGLVERAEEYMEARCAEQLSISDVLAVCGCPRRELFRAFQRYREYSPKQFLDNVRLRRAHQDLKSSSGTVTQVALRWGFGHLGRFAKLYRERYGQNPSQTRRQRDS